MITTEESSHKEKQSQHTFCTNRFPRGRKKETAPSGDGPTASVYRTAVRLPEHVSPESSEVRGEGGGTVGAVGAVGAMGHCARKSPGSLSPVLTEGVCIH